MSDLLKKSVHDLRVMAQAFGITEIFEKDAKRLAQEIEAKRMKPVPRVELPPRQQYDARLMTKAPSRTSNPNDVVDLLAPHIKNGLHLKFEDDKWEMRFSDRHDTGTLRQPLRIVLECAERLMRG